VDLSKDSGPRVRLGQVRFGYIIGKKKLDETVDGSVKHFIDIGAGERSR